MNRWGLELTTYNITFEWISGAQNKAADFLSRLVELPHDRQAIVQMLMATNNDGPTFKSELHNAILADTLTPDITTVTDIPDAMPKSLTKDRLHTLLQMQKTDPFCKCISKCLSNGKAPKHEADFHKDFIIQ